MGAYSVPVSSIPLADDVLGPDCEVISLPSVAESLRVPVSKVRQMVRDGQLIAIRRGGDLYLPAAFLNGDAVLKGLTGTVTVLSDAGFTRSEALRWLFTADESLPGRPIDALRGDRGTEVRRRAQAMAF